MEKLLLLTSLFCLIGMAKVSGPLLSIEARGKIADALVYFPWKGRNLVRQWLKPAQPNKPKQGYVRAAMYAIGKWVSKILSLSQGDALDSGLYVALTSACPAGMIWNAFICGGLMTRLQSAGTFVTSLFTSIVTEYSSLATDVITAFKTDATSLGLADFAFNYGYTTNIEAGLQLYLGAYGVYQRTISTYTVDPASYAASDVNLLRSLMTATA